MNELKRELSKVTGIDMFSPEYREIFKKYFPNEKDAEEERANEILDEVEPETNEEVAENIAEDNKEVVEESNNEEVEDKNEEIAEDIDKAEDEREIDKIEEEKAENPETAEEKAEEVKEESEVIGNDIDKEDELFDAKLELALVRKGVREDKIDPAKRLIKYELRDTHDLDKVNEILKDYPEWVKNEKPMVAKFGMAVDESADDLTAEERRLKEMGINPRD